MILCLDVDYQENKAQIAGVAITQWTDEQPAWEGTVRHHPVADYEPGQFYRRELPCLLSLIKVIPFTPSFLVVDSYVWLGQEKPGLGAYLYKALAERMPVIGVAKSHFRQAESVEVSVLRGESRKPLYITTAGVATTWAADRIQEMAGPFRLPTMLKRVDEVCRQW